MASAVRHLSFVTVRMALLGWRDHRACNQRLARRRDGVSDSLP